MNDDVVSIASEDDRAWQRYRIGLSQMFNDKAGFAAWLASCREAFLSADDDERGHD